MKRGAVAKWSERGALEMRLRATVRGFESHPLRQTHTPSVTILSLSTGGGKTIDNIISSYVYILRCGDGTFYTGWTTDLQRRVMAHNSGIGGKYTKSRLPVELVYSEEYKDRREAQKREYAIKQLSRAEKLRLIKSGEGA